MVGVSNSPEHLPNDVETKIDIHTLETTGLDPELGQSSSHTLNNTPLKDSAIKAAVRVLPDITQDSSLEDVTKFGHAHVLIEAALKQPELLGTETCVRKLFESSANYYLKMDNSQRAEAIAASYVNHTIERYGEDHYMAERSIEFKLGLRNNHSKD